MNNNNRRTIKVFGRTYNILILPVLSLSNPDLYRNRRLVFDWGKSISHPHAKIAFAILKSHNYISRLIYDNTVYEILGITDCRSGRKAATIRYIENVGTGYQDIIDALMIQEFPKNTV